MITTVNDISKPPLTDELAHYGVKGMKWGVRRSDAELAKARAKRAGKRAVTAKVKDAAGRASKAAVVRDSDILKARKADDALAEKVSQERSKHYKNMLRNGYKAAEGTRRTLRDAKYKQITSDSYVKAAYRTTGEATADTIASLMANTSYSSVATASAARGRDYRSNPDVRKAREATQYGAEAARGRELRRRSRVDAKRGGG